MVHTRDGSRAVREFIAQGTAKVCGLARSSLHRERITILSPGPQTRSEGSQASHSTDV
jgi:hypothetical protein